jgi:MinD superfamily P-loop ATPase
VKELVVISGKGGTGKTTIAACFAALARGKVMVDADVDAADLFILLEPVILRREVFKSGWEAWIDPELCTQCGECLELCRYDAISIDFEVDKVDCEGCGVCAHFCPQQAIGMRGRVAGEWFISETRFGPFVHARLGVGEENSGKLVALVRNQAKLMAEEKGLNWLIVDGPPGVGCPVISSITGADGVLVVTEPTIAGLHDMKRVMDLADHFRVPKAVCINKWDINELVSQEIEGVCRKMKVPVIGRIPYHRVVTEALVNRKILVDHDPNCEPSRAVQEVWKAICSLLVEGQAEPSE